MSPSSADLPAPARPVRTNRPLAFDSSQPRIMRRSASRPVKYHETSPWIISASTPKNIALPLTDYGAMVLEPEITWGAGKVLTGTQALMLPADGQVLFPGRQGRPANRDGGATTANDQAWSP
jgi:hypothetical protein